MENRLIQVIKNLMKKHNIEYQKDMAKLLGINPTQFSRMMRMEETDLVNVNTLRRLYEQFGVTPNDVLLWEDETDLPFDRTKRNER